MIIFIHNSQKISKYETKFKNLQNLPLSLINSSLLPNHMISVYIHIFVFRSNFFLMQSTTYIHTISPKCTPILSQYECAIKIKEDNKLCSSSLYRLAIQPKKNAPLTNLFTIIQHYNTLIFMNLIFTSIKSIVML